MWGPIKKTSPLAKSIYKKISINVYQIVTIFVNETQKKKNKSVYLLWQKVWSFIILCGYLVYRSDNGEMIE